MSTSLCFALKVDCKLISLRSLCVLCVATVRFVKKFINRRGAEDAEVTQRRPVHNF